MTVLVTFTGMTDPFVSPSTAKPGPILSLLAQRTFDRIYLLSTPGTNRQTRATKELIAERHIESQLVIVSTGLEDPTDYVAIKSLLQHKLEIITDRHRGDDIWAFVTPGTPQINAVWLSIGEQFGRQLRLLEVHSPGSVSSERPEVRELRMHRPLHPPGRSAAMHLDIFSKETQESDEPVYRRALDSAPQGPCAPPEPLEADEDAAYSLPNLEIEPASGTLPEYLAVAKEVGIIGEEPCVREMLYTAFRCALRAIPVLITGETGTGKDLLAQYIHRLSSRSEEPIIEMNCAAITDSLAESELFGVKKGAYTGALTDREGKFGAADGGTLFLDEIGDLPLEIQAKLLRALENHEIQRVGDAKSIPVDVRIIAATNRDLHALVKERLFRDDLLSRLSVGTIHVPPLRERRSDIPLIAQYLLEVANQNEGVIKHFTPEALQLLTTGSWDRWNIRELRTAIERAWTMAETDEIDHHHFKILEAQSADDSAFPLPELHVGFNWQEYLDELRIRLFSKALAMSGGNASAAARLLGVTPQAISQFKADDA